MAATRCRIALAAAVYAALAATAEEPARAAPATPEKVAAVERELNDWFKGLASGFPGQADYAVAPSGDRGATVTVALGPNTAAGHLSLQDDGRWRLLDLAFPSPVAYAMERPAQDGSRPTGAARSVAFSAARQETTGLLDPSYASPSSVEQHFDDVQLGLTDGALLLVQAARLANQVTLNPAAEGRVDLARETTLEGVKAERKGKGDRDLRVTVSRAHLTALVTSLSREGGPALARALAAVGADRLGKQPLSEDQRRNLRTLLDALDGLASDETSTLDVSGFHVAASAGSAGLADASLKHLRAETNVASTNGVLAGHLDVEADGIDVPQLHAGPYADLAPTHVHVSPAISGIGVRELLMYLRQIVDARDDGRPFPSPAPLFGHREVSAGIDALALDAGPAQFDGHARMTLDMQGTLGGEGRITSTRLDALLDRMKDDPALRVPFAALTVAKGIGHADGDKTVWDLSYQGGKLLVNGIDILQMVGPTRDGSQP